MHTPPDPIVNGASACPTRTDLEGLLSGESAAITWEGLSTHLESCARCETVLDDISESSDVSLQRLSAMPPTAEDEVAFRDLHAQLLAAPLTFSGDGTMDELTNELPDDDPFAGRTLPVDVGRYRLIEPIGSGATGTVYRARHLDLERDVAIKILSRRRSRDEDSVRRFRKEVRAIGQLEHPNIVRATDAGEVDGYHYLVMEYAAGANLSELLQTNGTFEVADACEVIRQTALGLAGAHEQKMVHRDVKLSNLLLTDDGTVKLLDMGLVSMQSNLAADPNGDDASVSAVARGPRGTADYMSPEQWTDYDSVDHRSDLYSLGCTFFKLLTGTAPFFQLPSGCVSKREAHLSCPPPDLAELRPDAPTAVVDNVKRLLEKSPNNRVDSAAAVANAMTKFTRTADLKSLVRDPAGSSLPTRVRSVRRQPIYQRRQFLTAAGATLAAAGLVRGYYASQAATGLNCGTWRSLSPVLSRTFLPHDENSAMDVRESGQFEEISQAFTVQGSPRALLNLGRPTRGQFSFAAVLSQAPWENPAGLFFGYRFTANEARYDSVQVIGVEKKIGVQIVWSQHRFGLRDGETYCIEEPLAEAVVSAADDDALDNLNHGSVAIQITLGISTMPEFLLQGNRIPGTDWVFSFEGRERMGLAAKKRDTNYLGRLGIVCGPTTTTIREARLKYHATT